MPDRPIDLVAEEHDEGDDADQLEQLISAERLLTLWARRPGPADI